MLKMMWEVDQMTTQDLEVDCGVKWGVVTAAVVDVTSLCPCPCPRSYRT